MHKKNQQRKMFVFILGLVIAFMIVRILTGNEAQEEVVLVAGEINTSKYLDEQLGSFQVIKMSKRESDRLGESVVRSINDLQGKMLTVPLEKGTPVPISLLTSEKASGDFAQKTRKYLTLYKIQGGVQMLPPGVVAGDLIDIGLLYQDVVKKMKTYSWVMKGVQIDSITETGDLYIQVSQADAQMLTFSKDMGQFVLQLPGKKDVKNCADLTIEEQKTTECYYDYDKPTELTQEDVLEILRERAVNAEKVEAREENESTDEENDLSYSDLSNTETNTTYEENVNETGDANSSLN